MTEINALLTMTRRRLALGTVFAIVILLSGCEPAMPDDLPSLVASMNSDSETIAVAAANKIAKKYGRAGLVQAFRAGGTTARTLAPRWLAHYPDAEVEDLLLSVVPDRSQPNSVRGSALWALQDMGTSKSLPIIEIMMSDADPPVAEMARNAVAAIRARSK